MKKSLIACMLFITFFSSGFSSASLINEGSVDSLEPEFFSVRYRSFRNPSGPMEILLGYGGLRTGVDRAKAHVKYWGYGENVNSFTFAYIPEKDIIMTTVFSPFGGAQSVFFDRLSSRFFDPTILDRLNYLQISMSALDVGVSVALSDVRLNGQYLGDFSVPSATSGYFNWYLAGYDLSSGFNLTGNIILHEVNGKFTHRDHSMVEIVVGATPIPLPTTVSLFGAGLLGLLALRYGKRIRNSGRSKVRLCR